MLKNKFRVGDIVEVKPDTPGYQLWYKGRRGIIVDLTTNDEGELRYLVKFSKGKFLEEAETLPFADWELRKGGKP